MKTAAVSYDVDFQRHAGQGEAADSITGRRIPRVALTLALAHQIDLRIRSGEWKNLAEAARSLGFTRARVTQIANLLLLAPAIQEAILDLPPFSGREPITERDLRPIVAEPLWEKQLQVWRLLRRNA